MKLKLPWRLLCALTILLAACNAEQAQDTAPAEVAAIAKVQIQKLRYADMSATLTVYGSVVPLSNTLHYESFRVAVAMILTTLSSMAACFWLVADAY